MTAPTPRPTPPRSLSLPSGLGGVVVVDVEGNGRQPPEIVEIALLDLRPGVPVTIADLRAWLVRPAQPVTGFVTSRVHGISNADVAAAPSWRQVAADIADALAGRVLVAHNAGVERRVLAEHLPGFAPPLVLDTLRLARAVWPDLPGGHSLDNLIAHLEPTSPDPTRTPPDRSASAAFERRMVRHRAGYDTWMTAALLLDLIHRAGLDDQTLHQLAALPESRTPSSASRTRTEPDNPEGRLW
jgi:DNA polymerase III epsilon subunit-like protein